MRESIGSGLLFNIVITFVIIMIGVLVGSLAYSKAFKVKNKIIDIIENNGGYDETKVKDEITQTLLNIGYNPTEIGNCKSIEVDGHLISASAGENNIYCVYKIPTSGNTEGNFYYKVTAYVYFDIPIIGTLHFPISGETKIIYDTYIDIETEE